MDASSDTAITKDGANIVPMKESGATTTTSGSSSSLLRKMGQGNKIEEIAEEPSKDLSLAEMMMNDDVNKSKNNEDGIDSVAVEETKTEDDRRPKLSDAPRSQSQNSSFRMEWSMEQMNTSYGHRSWFRECHDSINQFRYQCGMIINNQYLQTLIILLISINAIMMGLATFSFVKDNQQLSDAFETTDYAFLIIFTVELGLQFVYHGLRLLLDGWLVFDLIIIMTSWAFESVQIVRAFRIFRALRLITRIKILKNLVLGKSRSY
jgi:hypothetical protein